MPEFLVTYEMVDDYNRNTRKTFTTTAATADFAAAAAAAAALFTDLAVLTELRVLAYTVGQRVVVTDSATAGANRDEGLTLTLLKSDNYKAAIKVPGPINAIFDANGNVLTPVPAAVQDFIDHFADGAGGFTFSDGEQWTEFVKGVLDK